MFDLVVLNGSRAGTRVALPDVPMVVGRSSEAHLRIDDPWISNLHALFEQRGDEYWVVDLGSRNGTFVGKQQVREARVTEGALLAFGRTEARVEPHAADADRVEAVARTPGVFDPATLTARGGPPVPARGGTGSAPLTAPGPGTSHPTDPGRKDD